MLYDIERIHVSLQQCMQVKEQLLESITVNGGHLYSRLPYSWLNSLTCVICSDSYIVACTYSIISNIEA
jgi:hypothetical protein